MKLKVIVDQAEEGGYWAEVPSIPGCATQGETLEELLLNLNEAVKGCLSVDARRYFGDTKEQLWNDVRQRYKEDSRTEQV